jgi:hypothetical protein
MCGSDAFVREPLGMETPRATDDLLLYAIGVPGTGDFHKEDGRRTSIPDHDAFGDDVPTCKSDVVFDHSI